MTDEIPQAGDTPAPDANAELPNDGAAAPEVIEPAADDASGKEKPDGFTKRIDELTRDFRTAQRERDAERFEKERMRMELEQLRNQPRQAPADEGEKTLADFDFDDAKYADYIRKREAAAFEKGQRTRDQQDKAARNWAEFQKRADAYAKDSPGYTEAFQRLQGFFPSHVAEGLAASEEGPALVEFLGNNIREAMDLRNADPFEAGRLLGKLEGRVATEREKAKAKAGQTPPPPPPKVDGSAEGSGASAKPDSPESDALSDAEWARRRNAQVRARAQRK